MAAVQTLSMTKDFFGHLPRFAIFLPVESVDPIRQIGDYIHRASISSFTLAAKVLPFATSRKILLGTKLGTIGRRQQKGANVNPLAGRNKK
jgi:hypothetical protein